MSVGPGEATGGTRGAGRGGSASSASAAGPASAPGVFPGEPLSYHDPVTGGPTDPAVIRHEASGQWWMFTTQRRPCADEPGVAWVHGSRIAVAHSDDGVHWAYVGTLDGLDAPGDPAGPNTHWAPEVIFDGERYRMYLTVIAGVPDRWEGHPRRIREYRSDDLRHWTAVGDLALSSDRVIDAAVARCPDGRWRLWYKDEADDSTTWAAVSDDLGTWRVEGRAIGGRPHEGPNVFALGGSWWMLVDEWRGMGVYRSDDAVDWERQGGLDAVILAEPGPHPEDRTVGRHGDVVVDGDRALLYYFTHPWWDGGEVAAADAPAARLSTVHAATLTVVDGRLECTRGPVHPLIG
ncbi:family 43 glycosylhydrolase [Agromyces sp. SYSU T00194]|uniref:family 43 glycosylhydrolase n=1 Tax=Agromyces chitinivorans TaxID=3158560 RepID=UPI003398F323